MIYFTIRMDNCVSERKGCTRAGRDLQEYVILIMAINTINAWNRLNIASGMPPPQSPDHPGGTDFSSEKSVPLPLENRIAVNRIHAVRLHRPSCNLPTKLLRCWGHNQREHRQEGIGA